MRQQIARVTVRSKTEKPHFYVTADVDMTEAMALRQQINKALESEGVRVTVNDLIIKACVEALKVYPKFNAYYADDAIQMNPDINIGIAIAVEEGLLMPAIMKCNTKTLKQIAVASRDLATRAQSGSLRPQEYSGGTFSISNLGMFDVTSFVAIIQPPQSAIIAVGTVSKKAVVVDDEIRIRQIMTATLAADHRVVDGAEGARFLIEVKRLLENPMSAIV
jgi:pyruvate dehydrogenase E2 component (dihydrolipoamide acetyltransferase)